MIDLTPHELARFIDHTLLKPDATAANIETLCAEARLHQFYAVCVNGCHVALARHLLEETESEPPAPIKVACTVGFPLGAMETDAKRFETEAAVDAGAHEIDIVMNLGWLKDRRDSHLLREIRDVVEAADERPVKVIIEAALLSDEQKRRACALIVEGGAHFVKTSTGFNAKGASVADVTLLREAVGPKFGVKASGGIRDTATALSMIEAGANRIGTSSSVAIIQAIPEPKVVRY